MVHNKVLELVKGLGKKALEHILTKEHYGIRRGKVNQSPNIEK